MSTVRAAKNGCSGRAPEDLAARLARRAGVGKTNTDFALQQGLHQGSGPFMLT